MANGTAGLSNFFITLWESEWEVNGKLVWVIEGEKQVEFYVRIEAMIVKGRPRGRQAQIIKLLLSYGIIIRYQDLIYES